MRLMIEFFGVSWNDGIFEVRDDAQADEVIVPNHIIRNHEEPKELF